MNVLALCCLIILLCSTVLVGSGSYGVDYYLSNKNKPSEEDGFHGTHSAKLDYDQKKRYIKIDLEDPLPFEDLEKFTTKIKLLTGNGTIGIDIYLDGDGDGRWRSKSEKDLKFCARPGEWGQTNWSINQWIERDAFDFAYYETGSKSDKRCLNDWQEESHPNLRVVQIYIRLYKPGLGVCLIDYLKINDMVLSFEPNEGPYMKEGKPSRVTPGYRLTYTITYGNDLTTPVNNLTVVEHYDLRTGIVSIDPPPDPGTNNVWTIGTLQPGEYGQIKIVMRAMKQSCKADIDGQVQGTGYVSVRRRFTTERSGHIITNKVTISCDQFNRSAVVKTPVKPVTERSVTFAEHGSGDYESSEDLDYRSYKMVMVRDLNTSGSGSMINVSRGRPLVYNASWHARHVCVDQKRRLLLSEEIFYADRLDCEGWAEVRSTRSTLESLSNFSGLAIYEIGSDTKTRDAGIADVLQGSFSVRTRGEVYK